MEQYNIYGVVSHPLTSNFHPFLLYGSATQRQATTSLKIGRHLWMTLKWYYINIVSGWDDPTIALDVTNFWIRIFDLYPMPKFFHIELCFPLTSYIPFKNKNSTSIYDSYEQHTSFYIEFDYIYKLYTALLEHTK